GAEKALTGAGQIDSASVRAGLALATFYLLTRRAGEAEAAFKETLQYDAANLTANRALALIYLASHREQDAEPYLKTVATVSKAAPTQLALADYYTLTNRFADAVPILNALSASDRSAYAAAQSRLAALEYARGEKAAAHKRLDDVLHRDSKYSPALLLGARFLMAERRLDDAVIQAKAATQADPTSAQAQFSLGKLQALTNRFDEAAKAFTEVLKLNPRAVSAQMELSRAQLAGGKVDASIDSAREALKQ